MYYIPANKVVREAIPTTVLAPDGTEYSIGRLFMSTTVLQVKEKLEELSKIDIKTQELFHMEDTRSA